MSLAYRPVAANQSSEIERRWRILARVADTEPRTAERASEIARASAAHGVPIRTLQRWAGDADRAGWDINALGRKRPSDAGQKRVAVTRAFDRAFRAAGYPDDLLSEVASKADQLIKAAWTTPAQRSGWRRVGRDAGDALRLECVKRGVKLPPAAYRFPKARVEQASHFRVVDIYDNDRKRFDDAKPRIRRDNTTLQPMELVVMDVKPIDNIVRRADGTGEWTVRMIAFQDTGTSRIFPYFVQVKPSEGIRQEHVIEAFLAMVAHPEWGMPQALYRDNGTEFAVFDMIRSALALINEPGARVIINAKPYSGASKPIESKFSMLDREVFSQMGGWTGGNRMNNKTQRVGKKAKPYAGSYEDFVREAHERIAIFQHQELLSGPFKGMSPMQWFRKKIEESAWGPVRIDPRSLDAAFCERDTRKIAQGVVSIGGIRYRHPELPGFNGQTVTVALPWRRKAAPLVELPGLGWASLQAEMMHLPLDISGATDSGRMQQRDTRAVRELRRAAGKIDLAAIHNDRVVALPTAAAPAPLMDIYLAEDARELAAARAEADRRAIEGPDADERRRLRMEAELARWERSSNRAAG